MKNTIVVLILQCLFLIRLNDATVTNDAIKQGAVSPLPPTTQKSASNHEPGITTNSSYVDQSPAMNPGPLGFTNSSLTSVISPALVSLLRQVGSIIPGFGDNGFGLSNSHLKIINNFVNLLMNSTNTNPSTLTDILKSIQSSGLFQSAAKNLRSNPKSNTTPPDAAMLCEAIKGLKPDMDTTLGEFLERTNMSQYMDDVKELVGVKLRDVAAWCDSTAPSNGTTSKMSQRSTHTNYLWKKCQNDISQVLQGLKMMNQWALQMLDASAKPGSGLLRGNVKFLGNYKECQDVYYRDPNSLTSAIEGNICRVYIKTPDLGLGTPIIGMNPRIQWDLCMPKSCLDSDLNIALYDASLNEYIYVICTKDLDITDDGSALVAIAVLSVFTALLLAGTVMECCLNVNKVSRNDYTSSHPTNDATQAYNNKGLELIEGQPTTTSFTESNGNINNVVNINEGEKDYIETKMNRVRFQDISTAAKDKTEASISDETTSRPRWQRALLAFSIPRNTEKILSVKSRPGTIGCLHGIRVLSMGWVIIGHVVLFQTTTGQFENPVDVTARIPTIAFQFIVNAPLSVDTFFVMSGLLTCYLFLKTLGKKGKITLKEFVMYYVHRYWRLTPPLILWIMVVATLLKYIGEGRPAWSDFQLAENCRKNWWINILYINNVYKRNEPCVGVTWFLAHDMQFYVVAPLALIPWVYGLKTVGFLVSGVFVCIHIASTIWVEDIYNTDMIYNQPHYDEEIYFNPYTRVAPFAIGMMMGWVLWRTKCKVKMNKFLVFIGWLLCFGLILTLTMVTYDQFRDFPSSLWSHAVRTVFITVYRPVWALAISWMIFACATGYGGYINSILSWNGWLPLSRLTYSAYLVHLTIIAFEILWPEYRILFTLTSVSYIFIGFFVMSYAVGYILAVTVESPMLVLEKVLLG